MTNSLRLLLLLKATFITRIGSENFYIMLACLLN